MGLVKLEHGKLAYQADFAVYGLAAAALALIWAASLLIATTRAERFEITALAFAGLALWTLIEYALHRFLLHGMQPFCRWHAEHHQRPKALISTPTIFSGSLIAVLIFLPTLAVSSALHACALTFGVLSGYLAYSVTHHATHHWRADNAWLKQRKRWHALHHHNNRRAGYYGLTSNFWDYVFGSAKPMRAEFSGENGTQTTLHGQATVTPHSGGTSSLPSPGSSSGPGTR